MEGLLELKKYLQYSIKEAKKDCTTAYYSLPIYEEILCELNVIMKKEGKKNEK